MVLYKLVPSVPITGCQNCMFNVRCIKDVRQVKEQARKEGWLNLYKNCGGRITIVWLPVSSLKQKRF